MAKWVIRIFLSEKNIGSDEQSTNNAGAVCYTVFLQDGTKGWIRKDGIRKVRIRKDRIRKDRVL